MGRVLLAALVAALAARADAHGNRRHAHWYGLACGVQNWDLKTAADPEAQLIDPLPRETTISALISILPIQRRGGARIRGVETTTWKLTNVRLLEIKDEADQDYHLVLGDGRWTLVAEIPSPLCLPTNSVVRDAVSLARERADGAFSRSGGPPTVVTVAGVGFFDREHDQLGSAWNQIELHPVTAICFGQDCDPDSSEPVQIAAMPQPIDPAEEKRREALQRDVDDLCKSHAAAAQALQGYREILSSCRASRGISVRDCSEKANVTLGAEVQAAVVQANARENEFLRAWGAEAFVGIDCYQPQPAAALAPLACGVGTPGIAGPCQPRPVVPPGE